MSASESTTTAEPAAPVIGYATPAPSKLWHTGTLTYTAGGLVALFCWLLWGDFVLQLKEKSVPPSLQLLLKQFHATDFVNGLLIGVLPHGIALVLSPIVSYRSDRHRGRWGRRIPYLLIPTPIAVLSMVGLSFAPAIGRWMHQLTGAGLMTETNAILLNLGIFWTLFELSSIVANAVFIALINDVVPREMLGRFFALFRILGLMASMTFTWFLFGKVEEHYVPIFLSIGLIYGLGFGAMCLFVKEGRYPNPEEEVHVPGAKPHGALAAAMTYLRECFTHPYYIWFFLAISLAQVAFHPIGLFYIYMAKSLGMTADELGKQVSTPQLFCSLLLGYPVGWLCDKVHPIRVAIIATLLYAGMASVAFVYIRDARSFTILQIICGSLAGAWATAYVPLSQVIFPKLQFASFFSAMTVCISLSLMLASAVTGKGLDLLHHDYRYIYLWASVFCVLSLICMLVVYRKFNAFGGTKGYVAPLP